MGRHFALKIAPLCGGYEPHLIHGSLGPPKSTPQTECFCRAYGRKSLYFTIMCPLSTSKLPLRMEGSGPPSNTWFHGPTGVHILNNISIGSASFAGITIMSLTDHITLLQQATIYIELWCGLITISSATMTLQCVTITLAIFPRYFAFSNSLGHDAPVWVHPTHCGASHAAATSKYPA